MEKLKEYYREAQGYAWGYEDATKVRTAVAQHHAPDSSTGMVGAIDFAHAYRQAWEEYLTEQRAFMINLQDAYTRWQATNGETIFREGDETKKPRRN